MVRLCPLRGDDVAVTPMRRCSFVAPTWNRWRGGQGWQPGHGAGQGPIVALYGDRPGRGRYPMASPQRAGVMSTRASPATRITWLPALRRRPLVLPRQIGRA